MEIRFLGYGGAFDTHLVNSSAIVEHSGVRTLIDCGHSVFPYLKNSGAIHLVDQVVVTHLHDDHVGSLSTFAIYFSKEIGRGPLPIYAASEEFAEKLHAFLSISMVDPAKYVSVRLLSEARGEIEAIDTCDRHMVGLNTYSFVFREGEECLVYSGDLGDCNFLFEEIGRLGLNPKWVFHELSYRSGSGGHTYYRALAPWQDSYTIYGYHCDPANLPTDNPIPLVANCAEFLFEPHSVAG